MKEYILVYVTSSSEKESKKIAQICIKKKLAACANVFPSIVSLYEWKGVHQESSESVLILKTKKELFDSLSKEIKKHHSYSCPCVVGMPLSYGSSDFLKWIDDQTLKI